MVCNMYIIQIFRSWFRASYKVWILYERKKQKGYFERKFIITQLEIPLRSAEKSLEKWAGTVIVTLGRKKAFIRNTEIAERLRVREVKAIDSQGADDIFMGSFIYSYLLKK